MGNESFPGEMTITSLCPDVVVWSTKVRSVLLAELTILAEEAIQAAHERKMARAAECWEAGWETWIYPTEVGCREAVGLSTHTPSKACRRDWREPEEGNKRACGAEKWSMWLWGKQLTPETATGNHAH